MASADVLLAILESEAAAYSVPSKRFLRIYALIDR